ncbi:MAG: Xanthine phosphoribosyltransferase [Aeromicrobium sp.]|nr:Xanthine phosphoribosyltransferase [Aeromicrobium sp.]
MPERENLDLGAVRERGPRSIITADYAWRRTDRWINFPWSTEPPVVSVGVATDR